MTRCSTLLALLFAATAASADGKAPTKAECFDAHERAQLAQKERKLLAARQDYALCSHAACPKLVKTECEAELPKVVAALSSVVVRVTEAGRAASAAKVTVDGKRVEAGVSVAELEPGEHVFRAELPDGRSAEKRVALREGERDSSVVLDIGAAPAAPDAPPAAPAPAPEPESQTSPAVWVLGGVALVGLGGFVAFGLSGKSQESDLDSCKPDCQRDDVDAMRRSYLFADISLGVALVATGVGAYLYVSGKEKKERGVFLRTAPAHGGVAASVGTRF